jgi:hypothetical protein
MKQLECSPSSAGLCKNLVPPASSVIKCEQVKCQFVQTYMRRCIPASVDWTVELKQEAINVFNQKENVK